MQFQPLGLEDLVTGVGTFTQTRGTTPVTLTKINASNFPYDSSRTLKDVVSNISTYYNETKNNKAAVEQWHTNIQTLAQIIARQYEEVNYKYTVVSNVNSTLSHLQIPIENITEIKNQIITVADRKEEIDYLYDKRGQLRDIWLLGEDINILPNYIEEISAVGDDLLNSFFFEGLLVQIASFPAYPESYGDASSTADSTYYFGGLASDPIKSDENEQYWAGGSSIITCALNMASIHQVATFLPSIQQVSSYIDLLDAIVNSLTFEQGKASDEVINF